MAELAETKKSLKRIKEKLLTIIRSNVAKGQTDQIEFVLPLHLRGEQLLCRAFYTTIHFVNSTHPPKNFFIKTFSNIPLHNERMKKIKIMEKEVAFFNQLLPALRQFTHKFPSCTDLLNFFPKYFYGDETCLITENLVVEHGFIMLDKEKFQDNQTAQIVIENLAKFHAASFAFIKNMGREAFTEAYSLSIIESIDISPKSMLGPKLDNGIITCIQILKDNPTTKGSMKTIEKLELLIGKILPTMRNILTRDENMPLLVFNHGDCWNNNMLFKKHPETGSIVDHAFVDFQLTRFGSPCLDLGYFIMTSVKSEVRKDHFENLMRVYYDEFEATAQAMGTKCPITFEILLNDFKRFCSLGYLSYLSTLATIGAFKGIDTDDVISVRAKPLDDFNRFIHNWLSNNPDKAREISSNIVNLVEDYEWIQNKRF